ncbi:MAG: hypothetical protein HOV87_23110 [Catenulispora sp.]|nr:hypothetical protein [Catenulispora sp.]
MARLGAGPGRAEPTTATAMLTSWQLAGLGSRQPLARGVRWALEEAAGLTRISFV